MHIVAPMTSVLLVDSPSSVREALRQRLSLEPGVDIIAEAEDANRAMTLAQALAPDVVLLDAEAAYLDASALVRALFTYDLPSTIVVLTQHPVSVRHRLEPMTAMIVDKHDGFAALLHVLHSAAGTA